MITPRTTRLLRVPDLRAMHSVIARFACVDPAGARACAVVVPTRGAADELRRTLEDLVLGEDREAVVFPDLVTRDELYTRLHERLPLAPALLSDFEREVILRRAAREAAAHGMSPPFQLRAGLFVEILAFYDELRRRDQTVDDFARLMVSSLEPSADVDRGAARMLEQTRFLSATFHEFEHRVARSGRLDEHGLRARLLDPTSSSCYRHVIATVLDQPADPDGLWIADYDLLARLPGLQRLDIIATEAALAAGFHERIHHVLPGIEEEQAGTPTAAPLLLAPDGDGRATPPNWFVCRDREEELAEVARAIKARRANADDWAVVFQRPLPYLYLARQVFADAQVPFRAADALPLAAEPFVAALDLLFSFAASEGTRASMVDMLASPHWRFEIDGRPVTLADVVQADAFLRGVKYAGGWERLSEMCRGSQPPFALRAADATAVELREAIAAPLASVQLAALLAFIRDHERLPASEEEWYARHLRARAAVLSALQALSDAHARHDDEPLTLVEIVASVRRWIEGQTFAPRAGSHGVALLDARAAAYASVSEVRLVGLVETDWPERGRRSIFYPAALLAQLGWPVDADRRAGARARFHDLLVLAKSRVSLSTFTLEEDAIVPQSPFLEDLDRAGLVVQRLPAAVPSRVFIHEALIEEPVDRSAVRGAAAEWLALRLSRSPAGDAAFHGGLFDSSSPGPPAVYAVSRVERYLDCPFKYFAAHVLRLPEERDDESGLTPQERGQFLHEVFHAFFAEWHQSGGRAITAANMADATALFERVAEGKLTALSTADRALERTYLLGSAAASGLAERAFGFEVEQGDEIIERLLEYELEGAFEFADGAGARQIQLRGKADRIDLLADGTLRIVDYKLGRAPKPSRALQLPVYGLCAQQRLHGRHGRTWMVSRAGYVAFREKNPFVSLGSSSSLEEALSSGQARLLAAVDAIEGGVFPPKPDEPFMCTRCAYPSVCRKDYVGDE